MALPKLKTQIYKINLPSTGEEIKFRPFLMKEQKILMIAQESEADEQMQEAIANVIQECTFQKIDPWTCPAFDLEYVFVKLRGKSIGESVELTVLCPDDNETRVPVTIELDKLECTMVVGHTNEITLSDDVKLVMKYPTLKDVMSMGGKDVGESQQIFNMLGKCVHQIVEGETIHQDIDIPETELTEFLDNLNSDHLEKIGEFFDTMPKLSHTVNVVNPKTKKKGEVLVEGFQNFFV